MSVNATGYVNAGGRGTRLNPIFTPDTKTGVSKALLEVGSPPVTLVEHQVNRLLTAGMDNVIVGTGDHETVAAHVERVYGNSGCVRAVFSPRQLGHGGDLLQAIRHYPKLFRRHIVVANVDTILDWCELEVLRLHCERSADLTSNLTLRRGVPNEGAFYVGDDDRVLYHRDSTRNILTHREVEPQTAYRGSATGALIVSTEFLCGMTWQESDGPLSIYTQIVAAALIRGKLYAFNNQQRFFIDIGTVATWNQVQRDQASIQRYLFY